MGTRALLHKTFRFRISKIQSLRLTINNSHTRKLNNSLYEYGNIHMHSTKIIYYFPTKYKAH